MAKKKIKEVAPINDAIVDTIKTSVASTVGDGAVDIGVAVDGFINDKFIGWKTDVNGAHVFEAYSVDGNGDEVIANPDLYLTIPQIKGSSQVTPETRDADGKTDKHYSLEVVEGLPASKDLIRKGLTFVLKFADKANRDAFKKYLETGFVRRLLISDIQKSYAGTSIFKQIPYVTAPVAVVTGTALEIEDRLENAFGTRGIDKTDIDTLFETEPTAHTPVTTTTSTTTTTGL